MGSRWKNHVLITGSPGVGKTTVIRKVAASLAELHPVGFYTVEIREEGVRQGFELVALDGRRSVLSHVDISGPNRVGKYGVDVGAFEAFLDAIDMLNPVHSLIMIDEIGKMEWLSVAFRRMINTLL